MKISRTMKEPSHEIYLLFFSPLVGKHAKNGGSCSSGGGTSSERVMAKYIAKYSPPFVHVKIAFKMDTEFMAYSFTDKGYRRLGAKFLTRNGYSVLKIMVSKRQHDACLELCERFFDSTVKKVFSRWKALTLGPRLRRFFFLSPVPMPTRYSKVWMCSEFVSFVLQEARVLRRDFHPTLTSPSSLFCIVYHKCPHVKKKTVNPFAWDVVKNKKALALTNAVTFYCKTMNVKEEDIPDIERQHKAPYLYYELL